MVYVIICVMAAVLVLLAIKVYLLKKSAREITAALGRKLKDDTNTGLRISGRDKDMRTLTAELNTQLRELRKEHLIYHQGNTELKNAITNISHDIRTPLTAICGYLEMMEKTGDPEKRARYLSIMKDRTELLKQLTDELFRYSIIVSEEKELELSEVFINQVLAESISSFYPVLSEKGITPVLEITDEHIMRMANKAALSRIFSNLMNNAVKYSDGDLIIRLSETGEITFSNSAKELSAVEVEQLFDRFYTVESARNSTGLGLSIVRTLAQRMGASASAAYENGVLTVSIIFPTSGGGSQ
ncbi:MAG: HAMP domain-containing histidine kinase [Ruminococcus sp.]|nr:HAMP domain-containing histidine kinase [Ruminococcus sp.]